MRWSAALVVCCVLAGCGSSGDAARDVTVSAPASPTPSESTPAPEELTAPTSPSPDVPTQTPRTQPCDDTSRAGIEETISAQLAAFANADFATARSFASKGFQSSVDDQEFQTIIEAQYGFLLENPEVEFLDCAQVDELAQILVKVTASDIVDVQYRLVRESDGWRIDGAMIVDVREAVSA